MGYELYRDVKRWAPEGLTHREKLTAMVLADDANDKTRLTYSSTVDPEILRQAKVKNERDMRKVLAVLQDQKVIEHAGGGHNGRTAKYRFLHLDLGGCPGAPTCACPLALAVQIEPPTGGEADGVGGSKQPGYDSDDASSPVQKEPATDGVGGSFQHRRRSESNRPTPSSSSASSSLSLPQQLVRAADVVPAERENDFIDWIEKTHPDRGPGWWWTVADRDNFTALADSWQRATATASNGQRRGGALGQTHDHDTYKTVEITL